MARYAPWKTLYSTTVILLLASLHRQIEGLSKRSENKIKWMEMKRSEKFSTTDLFVRLNLPVPIYVLKKPVWKPHKAVIKRQASYDSNIQDLEALVAAEEAKTADAANMAGQPGRGWSDWSPWSACSVPCGPLGEQTRKRTCQNDPLTGVGCDGADTDTQTCTPALATCPETTSWSPWHDWGTCSVSCGDGVRTRERSCIVSDPKLSCPGDSAQNEPCNLQSCDLKESWADWSAWSKCSVTCGAGHRSRERMCQDDATGVEAYQCPGKKHTTEVCDQPLCSSGVHVKTVHAIEGHSAMLKCLYGDSMRPISIYWLTPDGVRVTHQSHHPVYEAIGDTLNIRHASSNMVGLFRCVVEDAHGNIITGEAPVDVLDCTNRPCRNGGVCQEIQAVDHFNARYTTYKCLCGPGYGGPTCEGGLGPGNITALVLFVILAGLAGLCFCMIYRLRQSDTKPTKMITPKENKLIVVTSRDALAVSCSESSSDATLSDSPVRQVDFDGNINAPPNLKASKGIGAIFPKFGWNNNNSLYRVLHGQLPTAKDKRASYRYTLANTSDLSISSSEEKQSDHSDQTKDANTNYNTESVHSTSTSSSCSSETLSSKTSGEKNSSSPSDSSESTSSSSTGSCSSPETEVSHFRASRLLQKPFGGTHVKTAYYCPANSLLETRLKPAPLLSKRLNQVEAKTSLRETQTQEKQPVVAQMMNNVSNQPIKLNTPRRPQSSYSSNISRHNLSENLSQSFTHNNLFTPSSSSDLANSSRTLVPGYCCSSENFTSNSLTGITSPLNTTQRSSSIHEQSYSSSSEQVLDDYTPRITTIQSTAPVVQGGYQRSHSSRNAKSQSVDLNQSCTLQNDPTVVPEVDTLEAGHFGKDCVREDSVLKNLGETDTDFVPTFADLFHSLREQLNKEREKATARVNCLTSIVSESCGRCETGAQGQVQGGLTNIPAYGTPCTHATSSPFNPCSHSGSPPRISLSVALADQTALVDDSSSEHFSLLCRDSPDTPPEYCSSPNNPITAKYLPEEHTNHSKTSPSLSSHWPVYTQSQGMADG